MVRTGHQSQHAPGEDSQVSNQWFRIFGHQKRRRQSEMQVGFHKGCFLLGVGDQSISKLLQNIETPAPLWIEVLRKKLGVDRLAGFFQLNPDRLFESAQEDGGVPEYLGLSEFEKIEAGIGIKDDQMLSHLIIGCRKNASGILSVLGGQPLELSSLSQVPNNVDSASAIQIDVKNLWDLLSRAYDDAGDPTLDRMSGMLAEITGLELAALAQEHLTGFASVYGYLDLVNAAARTVIAIEIRGPEKLKAALEAGVEEAEFNGVTINIKETSGKKVYSVADATPAGVEASFCLTDKYLYIGMSPRAVSSHLRKAKRTSGKIDELEGVQMLFADAKNGGLGKPIGIYYVNTTKLLQIVSSALPMVAPMVNQFRIRL